MNLSNRVYTTLVTQSLLPIGDRLFGQRMMQRLDFLKQAQWWHPDQLIAYRDQALRDLIKTAYHEVGHTRQLMDERGLHPEDIRTAADLHKLPILTKKMIRAQPTEQVTRPTGQATYDACSSGSTGTPFCVKEDSYTAGWYRAPFILAMGWGGWVPGVPHVQTGMSLVRSRGRWLKDQVLRCEYVSAYDLSDAHLDEILDTISSRQIKFLWGYPGSIYFIAKRALERGWNQPLTGVATWGDNLYAHYRQTIETTFQTRVTDTYGIGEGMQIAGQCGHGSHYHIYTTDVIAEFLNADDEPVAVGEIGNIVLTRLHAGPMPLIRYRVGDLGVSGGFRKCACGRGFEILESIQGRDTDVVVTPSGNRLIVHFFTGILEYYPQIDTFQIIQDERDHLRFLIVPGDGLTDQVIEEVLGIFREKGADIAFKIEQVESLPVGANGKRRFLINRLSQG